MTETNVKAALPIVVVVVSSLSFADSLCADSLRLADDATTAQSTAAAPSRDDIRDISIPAGELLAALDRLATQKDVQLIYRRDQLQGVFTQGVTGRLTVQDAVRKLLEGTELRLSADASTGAMLIAPKPGPGDSRI